MNIGMLAARNVLRNKFRTVATALGVAVAILTFVLLRTVVTAWLEVGEHSAQDRIATRHKVSFVMSLPLRYVNDIKQVAGVEHVLGAMWFGGKHPVRQRDFFATVAVQPDSFFQVYEEIEVPREQKQSWLQNRRGAIVGRVTAKKFSWKVGDRIKLAGTIYPGDWEFEISGIYDSKRRSVDLATFFLHWDYVNESLGPRWRDQVGWVVARISGGDRSTQVAKSIDDLFSERDIQTISMSEQALSKSFMGMFSAMLRAMDFIAIIILAIILLILGNTVAMGVRERTHEYGVLRAIGFLPRHLAMFILTEAAVIGALGGLLGLALSYPIVQQGIGRFLEENMQGMFPYFRIAPQTALLALVSATVLGVLAAAIPSYNVSKLRVVDALRRVG